MKQKRCLIPGVNKNKITVDFKNIRCNMKITKPRFSTKSYNKQQTVAIKDRWQQFLYLKHQIYPVDMYVLNDDLVMVFLKRDTKDLYCLYRQHKLV